MKDKNDLVIVSDEILTDIAELKPEYRVMVSKIIETFPAMRAATENFNKTQSQFMDNVLTVSHPTPLRNVRQILAEVEKARLALNEAEFKVAKKKIEIEMKLRGINSETDELKKKLLMIEVVELKNQVDGTMGYVAGAIRKIANYTEQYESILASIGKTSFTEEDFEREEEQYHIMKAFDQGLTAALARPDFSIDEGNLIYLNQVGVHPLMAKLEIQGFIRNQQEMIKKGEYPNHTHVKFFLFEMAKKYAGCSYSNLLEKGMRPSFSKLATLK